MGSLDEGSGREGFHSNGHRCPIGLFPSHRGHSSLLFGGVQQTTVYWTKIWGQKSEDFCGSDFTISDPLFWTPGETVLCDLEDVIDRSSTNTNLRRNFPKGLLRRS